MSHRSRTASCNRAQAEERLAVAQDYLAVAKMIMKEFDMEAHLSVAAGNAVLAGIAASDCICCLRLGKIHRGTDHRGATDLLKNAVPDGPKLSQDLRRLLTLKDEAHYGVIMASSRKAKDSIRWAEKLTTRAREEIER